ncbi:MAG: hypothetical protein IPJ01_10555 [Micavibrio sp.]|nr:hypothetical protein [Micavibrio sp.]
MADKKPKKKGLLKRIGIKLFKKVIFVTSKKEVKDLKSEELEKFKMFAEALKEIIRPEPINYASTPNVSYEGQKDESVYFYDFLKEWNNNGFFDSGGITAVTVGGSMGISTPQDANGSNPQPMLAISSEIEKKEPKVQLKPIEVFGELERIPTPITLENLEEKIAMFKMKQGLIKSNHYCKKEVIDFQLRLENRRKYKEYEGFFGKFDCTTSEKINKLVSKYELVLATSDLFIPTFPDEAIKAMNDYEENTMKLCGKKPIFYVIGEKKDFKKQFDRNDPILLAQSPFGTFWNILGAWGDKDILLLEEL